MKSLFYVNCKLMGRDPNLLPDKSYRLGTGYSGCALDQTWCG